jgi:hypothetical protein
MAHIRTKIRKELLKILQNTDLNILDNPVRALEPEEMPCASVTTEDDNNEYLNPTYPRVETRDLEIHIVISAMVEDNYQDVIDDYLLKIEDELGKPENKTLGGITLWHDLKGIQTHYEERGDEILAEAKAIYIFKFRTMENNHSINV